MCKIPRALLSVFVLLSLLHLFHINAVADDKNTTNVSIQADLPKPLMPHLSTDGKTLYRGLPLKAVISDPNPTTLRRIPAPAGLSTQPEEATASFSITYIPNGGSDLWGETCYTFPEEAKTTFNAAANIWANILHSSVPITISACWANLGSSSILGYSGGGPLHANFSGSKRGNTWYTGSLANALHGSDLASSDSDMHITYNSNFSFYYGTDGNTPGDKYDLMSIVLHEIAHGLNFSGSMSYSGGTGSWGYVGYVSPPYYPNIYDVFMRDGSGTQLINTGTYTNPSTALGSALVSDNIWFHGTKAMAANGNQRVKMYAPTTWNGGSSYSHLDYDTFNNTPNQLMVYAISAGESIHDPGVIARGLLTDLGWTISSQPPSLTSSNWPMYLAAINSGKSNSQPQPRWGAGSEVCCPSSSTTFYLTNSSITKKSYAASCTTAPTWEGWVTTTPGTKSFSWNLISSGCGSFSGSFSYALSKGKSYYFQIELDQNSNLVIYVYIGTTSSTASVETETDQANEKTANDIQASMQLVDKIPLNIEGGVFTGSSCEIAN